MKQVYPQYKRSRPLPFPLEDCSFPRSGLSDLATLGQTTVRSQKWSFPSRIVLTKCLEKLSKCNLNIFLCIKIEKREAEVLFEVEAEGRDLGMVRGSLFSIEIHRKIFKLHEDIFPNTELSTMSEGECFFEFSGFFL